MNYMICVADMTFFFIIYYFIYYFCFILLYYKFSNPYFWSFFCMRKGLPSILEGGSPEFWRKESGRFFGRRKESFLLEKNRDRIKEKKGVLKKGETIIGEGTHGFDGEDFLHG